MRSRGCTIGALGALSRRVAACINARMETFEWVIALLFVGVWNQLGYFDRERHAAIANAAIYWHFVDAVWVTIFFTFYITPYLW